MDSFNPTTKTQAALTSALQAASSAGNPEIRPAHLLMALLTQNEGIAGPLLEAVGVDPATIRAGAQRLLDQLPSASGASSQPQLSRESLAAITTAQGLATEMDDEYVSTEHLMVGLATGDSEVAKLLTGHGASPEALREAFTKVREGVKACQAGHIVSAPITAVLWSSDGRPRWVRVRAPPVRPGTMCIPWHPAFDTHLPVPARVVCLDRFHD